MKTKDYVERYGTRLMEGDTEAVVEIFNQMVNELNSQCCCQRIYQKDTQGINRLIGDFNRKGNVIVELLERKFGRSPLRRDWFSFAVKLTEKEGDNP